MAITYFCPAAKNRPSGGVKVIYRHAEALAKAGIDCAVFHQGNPGHRETWFESDAPIRTDGAFDKRRDFIVIPEVWAGEFAPQCYERGFTYAVFVQNGYSICLADEKSSPAGLRAAYRNAALILSISDDTTAMISLAYPEVAREKIVRVIPSADARFAPGEKSNTISYMPRKLADHANKLRALLELRLPAGWDLVPIDRQGESDVAACLARSRIFLSLCDQEGFGLPPLEAALSGALVVGYTGQAAEEYFRAPNFRKIANGDFRAFVAETLGGIEDIGAGLAETPAFNAGIAALRAKYSREAELRHLLGFAERAQGLMAQRAGAKG